MAFKPSSTIYLCNVPFDSTYKNQIYFDSSVKQYAYFAGKMVTRFAEYLTIRETLPDGSLQSSVKVGANIDDLRTCNYMFYQNANHGAKFFYAFIKKLIYINEKTTQIVFETDVYQTWLFDVTLLDSYVVREHSETDKIGDNTVPEKFNCNTFVRTYRGGIGNFVEWGYLVGSANPRSGSDGTGRGRLNSGVYQGLYFYYFDSVNALNSALDEMETSHSDCIQFIALIPKFCLGNASVSSTGFIASTTIPNTHTYYCGNALSDSKPYLFEGEKPIRNNKLFTYPYTKMVVTNFNGDEAEYRFEWFSNPADIRFKLGGDISANPSITAMPLNYNINANEPESVPQGLYCDGISLTNFPQCSCNTDTYKLWLAKNQFGNTLETVGNVASIGFGVGSAIAGNPLGLTQAMGGVMGILNTVNENYQAKRQPNSTKGGAASSSNLKTALKYNCFAWWIESVREEQARMIDDFFTMYGYQTNRVKKPNVSKRPYFNYVQTVDINISGCIPNDDMEKLKAMYNNGVTLWKSNATVGNYSVNNAP